MNVGQQACRRGRESSVVPAGNRLQIVEPLAGNPFVTFEQPVKRVQGRATSASGSSPKTIVLR